MVDQIRPVMAYGPEGCTLAVARGEGEFGTIAGRVEIDGGEVWEIHWPGGVTDLWFQASSS